MSDAAPKHPAYGILQPLTSGRYDAGKVAAAVAEFSRKTASSPSEGGVENFLWDAWTALLDIAGETPWGDQWQLIDFLVGLRKERVVGSDDKALSINGAGEVFKDLPTFGWVAREIWNFDVRSPTATAKQLAKFDNQSHFLARLTAKANPDDPKDPLDYSLYALWALRTAFEEPPPTGTGDRHIPAVKNAAIWIVHAGSHIRDLCAKRHDLPDRMGVGGTLVDDRGWKGFSEARWGIWKVGFEAAERDLDAVDPETKKLIEAAALNF